jgi:3-oxoacyl-[acyl-carrier-protein] synthase-3
MKFESIYLSAIGTCTPPAESAADAVSAGLYDAAEFAESGLRSVLSARSWSAPEMTVVAAREALERWGERAGIDMLLHSSVFFQGPEMWSAPAYVARELGLTGIQALEVRNGCNGVLSSMELAARLLGEPGGSDGAILVTTGDNFTSPLFNRWAISSMGLVAGDGASAAIMCGRPGWARLDAVCSQVFPELEGMQRGDEPLFPPTGSSGSPIDVVQRMESFKRNYPRDRGAFETIVAATVDVCHRALAEAGLAVPDLRWAVCNNASRFTTENVFLAPLGLPLSRSTWEYGCTVGHVGASDHLLSLEHLRRNGLLEAGDRVLLVGGAPGWSAAAAVLTIDEVPDR